MYSTGTGAGIEVLSDLERGKEVFVGLRERATGVVIHFSDPVAVAEVLLEVAKRVNYPKVKSKK